MKVFNKNVFNKTAQAVKENPKAGIEKFKAHLEFEEGLRSNIRIRNFAPFKVDEPEVLGSTNLAPNPIEYLISGAVGCFTVGVALNAHLNNVKINSLSADLEANLDMGVFFDAVQGGEHGITEICITLTVDTDGTMEQINSFVQKSLSHSPVLNSLKMKAKVIVIKK